MTEKQCAVVQCPCNPQRHFASCCEPYLTGQQVPELPEALMRSRYTAYTIANIDYIQQTMRGKALSGFQATTAARWAKKVTWIALDVMHAVVESPTKGTVEFEARFIEGNRLKSMHERSEFVREAGRWYYVDGEHLPARFAEHIVSRNMLCPCGSQRKFKNCHGV